VSLFDKAFTGGWLAGMAQAADGNRSVSYTRAATTITVPAVLGQIAYRSQAEGSAPVRIELGARDYMILVADLSSFGVPALGDLITDGDLVFEVQTPDTGERHWRYTGPDETEYRIHTNRVT